MQVEILVLSISNYPVVLYKCVFIPLPRIRPPQSRLSKATTISSDKSGLYPDILCFSLHTCWMSLRSWADACCLLSWLRVIHGSSAFLSYFFSSSMNVFFIYNTKHGHHRHLSLALGATHLSAKHLRATLLLTSLRKDE